MGVLAESDNESVPTSTPTKSQAQVRVKTLDEIRLEKIQMECASWYQYDDDDEEEDANANANTGDHTLNNENNSGKETSSISIDLRNKLKSRISINLGKNENIAPGKRKIKRDTISPEKIVIKSLEQIRAEQKAAQTKFPMNGSESQESSAMEGDKCSRKRSSPNETEDRLQANNNNEDHDSSVGNSEPPAKIRRFIRTSPSTTNNVQKSDAEQGRRRLLRRFTKDTDSSKQVEANGQNDSDAQTDCDRLPSNSDSILNDRSSPINNIESIETEDIELQGSTLRVFDDHHDILKDIDSLLNY